MLKKWGTLLLVLLLAAVSTGSAELIQITLADNNSECGSDAVVCEGNAVTITAPGEYLLTGALSNGQVRIDCKEDGKVTVHLQDVSIHNETGAAILVGHVSPRIRISLMADTTNELSDGDSLVYENDNEPNGVIFSRSDLTIEGSGTLKVTAGDMDGIVSKDDLKIEGGQITVNAPRHGIKGKDFVEISDGDITITAGKDGIRSNNDREADRGYISVLGGKLRIVCGDDPFDFVTALNIRNAEITTSIKTAADQ